MTDDNKEWIENFRSGLHRWVMRLGAAGIFAMVGLQWESNQQLAETNKTLAVIEEKTNEVDKQQDVILSQQNSLERRMDRREEEAGRMSERLQVIERAHERTPHR